MDAGLIRQDLDKFQTRISEVEERVSTVEDTVRTDSREIKALQIQVKALQERAIDTENRLRHNNVRILGLPESRGPQTCRILRKAPGYPVQLVVERAHRVSPLPP